MQSLKALSVSTLFPSRVQPHHAIFVRNRLQHLAELCDVRVIVPIPYFPFVWRFRKQYKNWQQIPREDRIDNLHVYYPRFLSVPLLFKPLDGFFVALSVWRIARKLKKDFDFDLLDAHLAFPEGFACILLGKLFKKPVAITLRGHDINLLPTSRFPIRKMQIQYALKKADLIISVADALRRGAIALGADPNRSVTISNGVDTKLFFPIDREEARRKLGLPINRPIILSVGHLVERKGFHLIVEALHLLKHSTANKPYLVIVGGAGEEGDYLSEIKNRVVQFNLQDDVLFAGPQSNDKLGDWYNAADVFCLASSMEGWANVLLESLACGTPVVATNVWGTPEVINNDRLGLLVERDPKAIAHGLHIALTNKWNRSEIVEYAHLQTWHCVAERLFEHFTKLVMPDPES